MMILTTRDMADRIGTTPQMLRQWTRVYHAPCLKEHFPGPGTNGSGRRRTGWDLDKLFKWLRDTGRMDTAGRLKTRRIRKPPKAPESPVALVVTPGMVMMGLVHLLGAFAFACEHGGIPHNLQELLEAADLEKMNQDALDIIEEMALRHPKTEAQWMLIKPALAVLIGRAKAGAPGDNGPPIKITIQAGPNLADKIDLKVIGYNTADPGKELNIQQPTRNGQ